MEKSNEPSLLERLSKVQQALKAPKGQRNTFGNYNYRSCEDILEAVKPFLAEHGLTLMLSDGIEHIGDRYYVVAEARLTGGGSSTEVRAYAREEDTRKGMGADQLTGAASSYARKYALNGLFLIDDTADSDTTNDHGKKAGQTSAAKAATKEKARALLAQHTANGESATSIIRTILDKDVPETEAEMQKLITALETQ